jgi:AraC-like DNA-binding protein
MNADINILYVSHFYRIIDFKCKCTEACQSKVEYSKSFNISFVRKGNFIYKVFRHDYDAYTGYAIIDKPESEHVVAHEHHIPDECTIIDFNDAFYQYLKSNHRITHKSFFTNMDVQTLFVKTDHAVEYLHFLLLKQIREKAPELQMDCLVMDILNWFLDEIDNTHHSHKILPSRLKKSHLQTIEMAKAYLFDNFPEDIALQDIASHCHVSPFHFSRIFKKMSQYSPYQFLLSTRLANAMRLITRTELPISEVCFQSGFQSIEHFNAAFKAKYQFPPSYFKKEQEFVSLANHHYPYLR